MEPESARSLDSSYLGYHACFFEWTHHVELLGDASSAQLLHAVADVAEAGVVVLRVLLGKVIYVTERTILEKREERGLFIQGTLTSCKRKADYLILLGWGGCRRRNTNNPK